ncbi:hypothetical protein [Shinella sp.]|uniref:hypothetical protein n=1 Tax=Shinella sp. TaxID=1870904 RepID=UPI0039C8C98D
MRKEKGRPVGRDHINGIEGFWSYAKNWLYPYRGVLKKLFHLYLGETCYRFNHRDEDLNPLIIKGQQNRDKSVPAPLGITFLERIGLRGDAGTLTAVRVL